MTCSLQSERYVHITEHSTSLSQVVYVGDGNNIVHSWIRLAAKFNFEFVCACPKGFEPDAATVELANGSGAGTVSISNDPMVVKSYNSLHRITS